MAPVESIYRIFQTQDGANRYLNFVTNKRRNGVIYWHFLHKCQIWAPESGARERHGAHITCFVRDPFTTFHMYFFSDLNTHQDNSQLHKATSLAPSVVVSASSGQVLQLLCHLVSWYSGLLHMEHLFPFDVSIYHPAVQLPEIVSGYL